MFCNKCGSPNPEDASFCSKCGAMLSKAERPGPDRPNLADRVGRQSESGVIDVPRVVVGLGANQPSSPSFDRDAYAAVIGPKNASYYLDRFERVHSGVSAGGWNWAGALLTFYWMLYRKSWGQAILYLVASSLLVNIVSTAADGDSVWAILLLLLLLGALYLVPGFYANKWYFGRSTKRLKKAFSSGRDRAQALAWLESKGGTSSLVLWVISAISIIGILAAVALPAYQDYTLRAKTSEALQVTRGAATAVENYYLKTGEIPKTVQEAGYLAPLPVFLVDLTVDPENAAVTGSVVLSNTISGEVVLTPSQNDDKSITWTCSHRKLPAKVMPSTCRLGDQIDPS